MQKNEINQIAGAIVLAGVLIGGSILLAGNRANTVSNNAPSAPSAGTGANLANIKLDPVTAKDMAVGASNAKVVLVEYADFQCPFCGKFHAEAETVVRQTYGNKVKFVYRDYAFLGTESFKAAEAARCAADQGKFWEYHDYLFTHQNGENKGAFSNDNLKSFAKEVGLNTAQFNSCFDGGKYVAAVKDSNAGASRAGVTGTPKGFIVKNGKVVDTIDGAQPSSAVTAKLDAALK